MEMSITYCSILEPDTPFSYDVNLPAQLYVAKMVVRRHFAILLHLNVILRSSIKILMNMTEEMTVTMVLTTMQITTILITWIITHLPDACNNLMSIMSSIKK
jgi:hypothetical protein